MPQRRERVFVVARLGEDGCAHSSAALFEPRGEGWDFEAGQAPGPGLAAHAGGGAEGVAHAVTGHANLKHREDRETYDVGLPVLPVECATGEVTHALKAEGADGSEDGTGRGVPIVAVDAPPGAQVLPRVDNARQDPIVSDGAQPLDTDGHSQALVYDMRGNGAGGVVPNQSGDHASRPTDYTPMVFEPRFARNGRGAPEPVCPPLKARSGEDGRGDGAPVIFQQNSRCEVRLMGGDGSSDGAVASEPGAQQQNYIAAPAHVVRRFTCRECERLQGFPDDWTLIPWSGRRPPDDYAQQLAYLIASGYPEEQARILANCPDGPRYKAVGNSKAVPVIQWLGRRIEKVEAACRDAA